MDTIRIKNDIAIEWKIYESEGVPYDLTDKQLSFYLIGPMGRMKVDDFTVFGNSLQWTFFGKDQKYTGKYSVELCENEGKVDMHTVDVCNAFFLDGCSHRASVDGSSKNMTLSYVSLQSTVAFGSGPDVYVSAIKADKTSPHNGKIILSRGQRPQERGILKGVNIALRASLDAPKIQPLISAIPSISS